MSGPSPPPPPPRPPNVEVPPGMETSLNFLSEDRKDAFGIFYVVIDLSTLNYPEESYGAFVLYRLESVKDWS